MKTGPQPKRTRIPRAEQLRRAKRLQRERQREAGLVHLQLTLPKPLADKFVVARRQPEFVATLEHMLDEVLVRIADYPQLRDIAWNRDDGWISASEAFQLYERNWRFVDTKTMPPRERALLARLTEKYGKGVLNV